MNQHKLIISNKTKINADLSVVFPLNPSTTSRDASDNVQFKLSDHWFKSVWIGSAAFTK